MKRSYLYLIILILVLVGQSSTANTVKSGLFNKTNLVGSLFEVSIENFRILLNKYDCADKSELRLRTEVADQDPADSGAKDSSEADAEPEPEPKPDPLPGINGDPDPGPKVPMGVD